MWDIDHFPGVENVPWRLLIRARYVHEIDAVIASTVIRHVGAVAAPAVTQSLVAAATKALPRKEFVEATAEHRVNALNALIDWDDWCWTPWPRRWPPRRHLDLEHLADPIARLAIDRAAELISVAGSEELQAGLVPVLAKTGAVRR